MTARGWKSALGWGRGKTVHEWKTTNKRTGGGGERPHTLSLESGRLICDLHYLNLSDAFLTPSEEYASM